MNVSWALVTGPAVEPISLEEARQHSRNWQSQNDVNLERYIRAAREQAEEYLARGLYTQTWQMSLDRFYGVIYLPRAVPLQSAGLAAPVVTYYDSDGVLQTLSNTYYTVNTVARPGRIELAAGQSWPATHSTRTSGAVLITYTIGWTSVDLIPERIKQGIRMYVSYLDADREGGEEFAERARKSAESCWDDRVMWIEPEDWCC